MCDLVVLKPRWVGGTAAVFLDFPTSVTQQSSEQPAWKAPAVYNILFLFCRSLRPLTLGKELGEARANTAGWLWGDLSL